MDADLIQRFDDAQRRAIALLGEVVSELREGQTETDIAQLAEERLQRHGFTTWFHPPEVHIGARTGKSGLRNALSSSAGLRPDDLVEIDFGPATEDAFGDIGGTFRLNGTEPKLVQVARECARAVCGYANRWKTTGELYVYAQAWAVNHRLSLASKRSIGHAVLPREGLLNKGWPRSAHYATLLRRNQIHFLNPVRLDGLYAIRPKLTDGSFGASFEEMIVVSGDERRVLGRDSIEQVGLF